LDYDGNESSEGGDGLSSGLTTRSVQRRRPTHAAWTGGQYLVSGAAGVAGLALIRPRGTEPERAAGLGALAAVAFGPAGAAFWLVPVIAVGWRIGQLVQWAYSRARAEPPAGEFLN
jgi:hypothetical protein